MRIFLGLSLIAIGRGDNLPCSESGEVASHYELAATNIGREADLATWTAQASSMPAVCTSNQRRVCVRWGPTLAP